MQKIGGGAGGGGVVQDKERRKELDGWGRGLLTFATHPEYRFPAPSSKRRMS